MHYRPSGRREWWWGRRWESSWRTMAHTLAVCAAILLANWLISPLIAATIALAWTALMYITIRREWRALRED